MTKEQTTHFFSLGINKKASLCHTLKHNHKKVELVGILMV